MSGEPSKRSSLVPAMVGVVVIAAAVVLWLRRDPVPAPSPAQPIQAPAETRAPGPVPTVPVAPAGPAAPTTAAAAEPVPAGVPQVSTEEPPVPHAKKPKLTLEEKLALTPEHVKVMETRAGLIEKEIAQAEGAGRTQEVAEKKVMLARLRAHMAKLQKAVAEGREPE